VDLVGAALQDGSRGRVPPGAVAVAVAVDRRAFCRIEPAGPGLQIEAKDSLQKATGRDAAELAERGGAIGQVARVLRAVGLDRDARVTVQCRVPAGAGLGESTAQAVAVAAAALGVRGRELSPEQVWPLLRDAAAPGEGTPLLDGLASLHGGAVALHLEAEGPRGECLAVDPGQVEECLLLVDASRLSAGDGGAMARSGGGSGEREPLEKVAEAARAVRRALVEGRAEEMVGLIRRGWQETRRLAPASASPGLDRLVEAVEAAGGAAWPCGPYGGSVAAVWAPPGTRGTGPREAARRALAAAGFRVFPVRVDLRGLEVEGL
jgi:hypothetical protein